MSIGQRIALIAVLAISLGQSLAAAYSLGARRMELNRAAENEAQSDAFAMAVVLNSTLARQDIADLRSLPDEIRQVEHVFGMAIYDARSRQMVASNRAQPRSDALAALAERAAREDHPTDAMLWYGGTPTLAYAYPLRRARDGNVGAVVMLRDLSYIARSLGRARQRVVGAALFLILVMVSAVLGFTRATVTGPVARLIAGVRRIGTGDLTRAIQVRSRDEIGRIAEALNTMMTDLTSAREQIRADLETRIALEKSVEFERKLQHAQRLAAVGQVAASLAHEIGSPLHVIAGRARFAAGRGDVVEMKQNLEVIAQQADRITRVVEQMLGIARRSRVKRVERVPLADIAATTLELLGPQARQQGVALKLVERTPAAATTGDADALQQIMFNLVLNAVQAQPQGGSVEVTLQAVEEPDSMGSARARVVIEVSDRGPGVPVEQRDAIFEPFATGREGQGGSGLGLAVVRELAREHAGTVRVGARDGGGATFRVSLPSHDEEPADA